MNVIAVTIFVLIAVGVIFYILHKNYERIESPMIIISTFLSLAIVTTFIIILEKAYTIYVGLGDIDMDSTGQVGDFIGGTVGTILTAISIILLYKTLKEQRKSFNKSQIENRFFELLKFHRDNVNEISFNYTENSKQPTTAKGRHFFVTANKQLDFALEEFELFYTTSNHYLNDIYEEAYLKMMQNNSTLAERRFEGFYLLAKVDICYLVFFYGVSKNGKEEILEKTKGKYNPSFISTLINYYRLKPSGASKYFKNWKTLYDGKSIIGEMEAMRQEREEAMNCESKILSNWKYYPDNYNKFYGGHQFRLGHYFRHLYQIVCYVHYNNDLDENDKTNYIRILRGQLSDYEQKMFFYNSLSQLGRVWEISHSSGESIEESDRLISKYNIIKNICDTVLTDNIRPKHFYQ